MKRVLVFFGTRPEAIKLSGVIKALKVRDGIECYACSTGQHTDMLLSTVSEMNIAVDIEFNVMQVSQGLAALGGSLLKVCSEAIERVSPDLVIVHGDTASAYFAALSAFFAHIPIVHVEAGLRSGDIRSPFPEEYFRRSISLISTLDLAPTDAAAKNLVSAGKKKENIYVTGNTVIDAVVSNIRADYSHPILDAAVGKRLILVTAHRRENLGEPMQRIFSALGRVCEQRSDVFLICPLHKNPEVREIAHKVLSGYRQIVLCEPLTPIELHNVMARSFAVVTDSGGIQEEAAHLGVPTLVLRDNTERGEGVECGAAMLVGSDERRIIEAICELIDNKELYERMKSAKSPYGDGRASERIAEAVCDFLR